MTGTVSNLSFLCKRGREIRLGIGRRWVRPVEMFIVVDEGGLVGSWGSPLLPHLTSPAASRNKSATLLCVRLRLCKPKLAAHEGGKGRKKGKGKGSRSREYLGGHGIVGRTEWKQTD